MTDEERGLLEALREEALAMRFNFAALVEYLIDYKAIKVKDEEFWPELQQRSEQLRKEAELEERISARVAAMQEFLKNTPRQ